MQKVSLSGRDMVLFWVLMMALSAWIVISADMITDAIDRNTAAQVCASEVP